MGFYRGLATPLIGSMAEISTLMTSYGFFKRLLGETPGGPELPPWKLMLASGGAGIGVTCVLTPVELIKCKLQVQNTPGYKGVAYKGPLDVIYKICMQESPLGLREAASRRPSLSGHVLLLPFGLFDFNIDSTSKSDKEWLPKSGVRRPMA